MNGLPLRADSHLNRSHCHKTEAASADEPAEAAFSLFCHRDQSVLAVSAVTVSTMAVSAVAVPTMPVMEVIAVVEVKRVPVEVAEIVKVVSMAEAEPAMPEPTVMMVLAESMPMERRAELGLGSAGQRGGNATQDHHSSHKCRSDEHSVPFSRGDFVVD